VTIYPEFVRNPPTTMLAALVRVKIKETRTENCLQNRFRSEAISPTCSRWLTDTNVGGRKAAAKALWREKCPQVDFDLVTFGESGWAWERRRNGELVPLLGEGFRTKFSGRPDLLETTRAVD
jgi:hypothetical protein